MSYNRCYGRVHSPGIGRNNRGLNYTGRMRCKLRGRIDCMTLHEDQRGSGISKKDELGSDIFCSGLNRQAS